MRHKANGDGEKEERGKDGLIYSLMSLVFYFLPWCQSSVRWLAIDSDWSDFQTNISHDTVPTAAEWLRVCEWKQVQAYKQYSVSQTTSS